MQCDYDSLFYYSFVAVPLTIENLMKQDVDDAFSISDLSTALKFCHRPVSVSGVSMLLPRYCTFSLLSVPVACMTFTISLPVS